MLQGLHWDQTADNVIFASSGNKNLVLGGGKNYDGNDSISSTGALKADLSDLVTSYGIFESKENYDIDFLYNGFWKL